MMALISTRKKRLIFLIYNVQTHYIQNMVIIWATREQAPQQVIEHKNKK